MPAIERAASWWLGVALAALAWASCAPARAQDGDDFITLTLTAETSSSVAYSIDSSRQAREHRREIRIGPFSLSIRLTPRPDTRAPVPACMDKLDRALAESRDEFIKANEEQLQATRDALETLDSLIEEGLRTGVIEVGRSKIGMGVVDHDRLEVWKKNFREALEWGLRQNMDSLTRLLNEQYDAHARRVEIRNAAAPLCQATDLLRKIKVRRYELTEDGIRTASASFGGGQWSAEQKGFVDGQLVNRYRLEASSTAWARPSGAVEWTFVGDRPLSEAKDYVVKVLRLEPSQQDRLRGIFAALGERVEEARELDAAWAAQVVVPSSSSLEQDLREAADSALRTLWRFGFEPAPDIPSHLGEVGGDVAPLAVPELEGDTLIRLETFPSFVQSFPVDVVGEASVEQFGNSEVVKYYDGDSAGGERNYNSGPTRRAAAIRLRLGEDPSQDVVRWVLADLHLRLTFGLSPTPSSFPEVSVRALPGPDPFVGSWSRDWARHNVIAHGSGGTVRGTLLKSWLENRPENWGEGLGDPIIYYEVRYGWSVSVGGPAVADRDPAEPRPEEEIELRVVAADGAGFRPLDGPLPFGRPFLIEGLLGEDSDRRSLIVTLGAGGGREVVLTRSAEDPRLLRSETLYLMWESKEGGDGGD